MITGRVWAALPNQGVAAVVAEIEHTGGLLAVLKFGSINVASPRAPRRRTPSRYAALQGLRVHIVYVH